MALPRARRLAYVALTAAWILGLGGLGAELVLRRVWTPPSLRSTPSTRPCEPYVWAPVPDLRGTMVTSEYEAPFAHSRAGTRGRGPADREADEGRTLLVLGDSHVYGLGVGDAETFCGRLDAALPGTLVVNAGCNGYSTRQSLAVLDHLGAALDPDAVLLVVFWNDLEDNLELPRPVFGRDADGRVVRVTPLGDEDPLAPPVPTGPVARRAVPSYLAALLKESLRGVRYRLLGVKARPFRSAQELEPAWEVLVEQLALLRDRAAELDTPLVVACLPDHNQVNPDAVIKGIEPVNFEIQGRLFAELEALGIPALDLRPCLDAAFAAGSTDLFYYADRHMTPEGHRVVAEFLGPELEPLLGDG